MTLALLPGCVRLPRPSPANATSHVSTVSPSPTKRLNINTATAAELEKLPGVGPVMAARIIEHRRAFGPFRRAEHLMVVRGISDRRFRTISAMVTTE